MSMRSGRCEFNREVVSIVASLAIVLSSLVWRGSRMGMYKLKRYSHEGYLIKVVEMALAGEITRKLSPIRSWSNKDYDLKLGEKGKGMRVASSGSNVS
jgi:hypothetical protein